ncbi:alanine racemase [Clostridium sp. 'White wine YQ']|uniref:alanine racemase n=1 Tax=Clostridium sp. 'White wine YQ' TaxID=3027474 RepID=UPI0023665F9D|nr:alanine racemase [Clostridium sp. 'White wine YQ']MDD7795663.1 alanine racemase [Clostridium sp. 'White wine YQ']
MDESIRPVWAEINLNSLENNMRQIKNLVKDKKIYAVVKADGYGHGALDVAPIFLENGATGLAVAVITEALELRRSGVKAPILILGYTPLTFGDKMAQYDIEQTVYDLNYVKGLSDIAIKEKRNIKIHIALDTGMGRIGILPNEEGLEIVRKISKLPNIILEGIFTHFSTADETDKSYTKYQLKLFYDFTNRLEQEGIKFNVKHVSNSAAIMDMEETYIDGVRPGIIMYGYYPSDEVLKDKLNLKPALTLKTSIAHLKTLPEGMYISYGRKFKTERESVIATLPVGYADGYTRALSNKGKVIINGKLAPIVGRVCMDQVMVDVTDVGEVSVGDEVVLLGEQGEAKFNADDLAEILDTINYEIICMIGRRVPRVYIRDGKIVKIRNYV